MKTYYMENEAEFSCLQFFMSNSSQGRLGGDRGHKGGINSVNTVFGLLVRRVVGK